MSLARLSRPCAVKKLVGLSSAVLTFLPVERRFWVVGEQFGCRLEREKVLANRRRENNVGHVSSLPNDCPQFYLCSFKLE